MANTGSGMTRANFGDLLEVGLREVFFQTYSELPTVYDKIFHVLTSEQQQESDSSVSGFGQMVETSEGGAVTYEDALLGYDSNYVHKTYKKGFKVTKELYEDAKYNVINRMTGALAKTVNRTVETISADIFDNGFTSGTGADGKYLFDTQHPRTDGGTVISNADTQNLEETNLTTGLLAMRSTVDDKGQKILVRPDTLLIGPALEVTANVLMKSTGRTGTNYNEVNPYENRLNIVVWDYLASTTAWFLLDSGLHQLNFFWRKRPEFGQDENFDTDVALFKTRCRFSVGWSDWRGTWGSTGTA